MSLKWIKRRFYARRSTHVARCRALPRGPTRWSHGRTRQFCVLIFDREVHTKTEGYARSVNSRFFASTRLRSRCNLPPSAHRYRDFAFSRQCAESGQRKIGDLRVCYRCGGDGDAHRSRGDLPPSRHPHHRLFLVSDTPRFFNIFARAFGPVHARITFSRVLPNVTSNFSLLFENLFSRRRKARRTCRSAEIVVHS